jgi:hypothetical protein
MGWSRCTALQRAVLHAEARLHREGQPQVPVAVSCQPGIGRRERLSAPSLPCTIRARPARWTQAASPPRPPCGGRPRAGPAGRAAAGGRARAAARAAARPGPAGAAGRRGAARRRLRARLLRVAAAVPGARTRRRAAPCASAALVLRWRSGSASVAASQPALPERRGHAELDGL